MEKFATIVVTPLVIMGGLLLIAPMTTLIGACTGYIVSWFFGGTIITVLQQLHLNVEVWQFGAFLGFVSPFLRTKVST